MGTDWSTGREVAAGFEAYDDRPERVIGYPAVFAELGLGAPDVRTVLDYGCGPGKVALRVAEAFHVDVLAVDISAPMLAIARTRRAHPRIDYRQLAAERLKHLADASVDAAMSCYVFINVGDLAEIRAIAAAVHRVLRPGGRYAVLDTNPDTTGVRFSTFRSGEHGRRYAAGESRQVLLYRDDGEVLELKDHHWPRETYLDVLRDAGFTRLTTHEPLLRDADALQGLGSERPPEEMSRPPFLVVSGEK